MWTRMCKKQKQGRRRKHVFWEAYKQVLSAKMCSRPNHHNTSFLDNLDCGTVWQLQSWRLQRVANLSSGLHWGPATNQTMARSSCCGLKTLRLQTRSGNKLLELVSPWPANPQFQAFFVENCMIVKRLFSRGHGRSDTRSIPCAGHRTKQFKTESRDSRAAFAEKSRWSEHWRRFKLIRIAGLYYGVQCWAHPQNIQLESQAHWNTPDQTAVSRSQ